MPNNSKGAPRVRFFVTGGTINIDTPSYVERQADRAIFQALSDGRFCYVLTSRQMGKSSLMVRTAKRLREQGVSVIVLDLTAIGQNISPEQWYDGLCVRMGGQVGLEDELDLYWRSHARLGPVQRLISALKEVILPKVRQAVVFVDEIDVVRSLPFATDEFFAAIRECYNRRSEDPAFDKLAFCLLGVASPSDLIQDTRMTPFNIGQRIELNDFTEEEAAPLARGLEGKGAQGVPLLRRVLFWTGGHPYLTQRLCQAVAEIPQISNCSQVDQICRELFLSHRAMERDDNLIFVRERLFRNEADRAEVLTFYRKVLCRRSQVPDDETNRLVSLLHLSGIVRMRRGKLAVRNQIYEKAFNRAWIENHMPEAESRRQREAFTRGLVRATSIAAGLILAMTALVVFALWSRSQTRAAVWAALVDKVQLNQISRVAGQRFQALESIRQAAQIRQSPTLRDQAIACLILPDLKSHPSGISLPATATALTFSPDLEHYAFGNAQGEICLRRAAGSTDLSRWQSGLGSVDRIWFSPDHELLAVAHGAGGETVLSVWGRASQTSLLILTNHMQPEAVDFSPDGRRLAIGSEEGTVRILDLPGGQLRMQLEMERPCSALRFDPKGQRLAIASSQSLSVGIYDTSSGETLRLLHTPSPVELLAWHPWENLLAGAGQDRRIRLWTLEADEFPHRETTQQASPLTALAFSHSGHLLAAATEEHSVQLWDPNRGTLLLTLQDALQIPQLVFSPDDRRLGFEVSAGAVQFWEVASGEECRSLVELDADELTAIAIHPEGRLLAAAHANGVTLWDLTHARRLGRMPVGATTALRFHPVSGDLVDCEFRGTFSFDILHKDHAEERAVTIKPKREFYVGPGAVAMDVARTSNIVALAYHDRIRLARITNSAYAILDELIGEPGFRTVAIDAAGRRVASGNWKTGQVWVWDGEDAGSARKLAVAGRAHVCFSPDGRWLSIGTEKACWLWDTATWNSKTQVTRLKGASRPAPVAFETDATGSLLWAVAVSDTRVRLLRVNGDRVADLEAPQKELLVGLAFSPGALQLACATSARSVLVWDLGLLGHELEAMGLDTTLAGREWSRTDEGPLTLEIEEMNRLRFSKARHVLGLLREIGVLNEHIREEPEAWHYYRYRAEKFEQLGEFQRAIEDYHRWIELEPKFGAQWKPACWPYRELASLHLFGPEEVRDYAQARRLTGKALELNPGNADGHFLYGVACYRLDLHVEAQEHLETSRRLRQAQGKNLAMVLFYQAMCQAKQHQHQLAALLLQEAHKSYVQSDTLSGEASVGRWSDLLWEAERVVRQAMVGG